MSCVWCVVCRESSLLLSFPSLSTSPPGSLGHRSHCLDHILLGMFTNHSLLMKGQLYVGGQLVESTLNMRVHISLAMKCMSFGKRRVRVCDVGCFSSSYWVTNKHTCLHHWAGCCLLTLLSMLFMEKMKGLRVVGSIYVRFDWCICSAKCLLEVTVLFLHKPCIV